MPATQYAEVDNLSIAYQVCGSGPVDLVYVPGLYNHVEAVWGLPGFPEWMERLVRFARVITFDKRGSGMSDALVTPPTLEQRMADVGAVMDAVGCRTAWLLGVSEGGPMSTLFAATYPERPRGLVLWGTYARYCRAPDYPWGPEKEAFIDGVRERSVVWGDPAKGVPDLDLALPHNAAGLDDGALAIAAQASAAWEAAVCWDDEYAVNRLAEVRAV